ncbi:MAG: DISARM system SNF2-like helicase DrmD [Gemmatimonadota bacterium]
MFALVRNRRGVVSSVQPFDGPDGRLHLVQVEYKDDQLPREDELLWEREPFAKVLEPTALPNTASSQPMPGQDFDAILRASRWSAAMPFLDPDGSGPLERLPITSPFHGAVQVDDFQLVPLLKALRMPRVNLLIADDVGLGKTIEAGLILTELLLRRRIQRVLVLTPASLRLQWRDEMWDKFSLPFDVVDRAETHALRRRLGMDANPWRSHSRIIASYHYLRQEDVLEQFLAACRTPEGSPHLPWDLLIVDECHNLMPSAMGEDSDLCRMLRLIAPQFEHRLFLSATPHNGHTRSFTGLLEILDPVRFSQTDELKPAERERVQQIVIRRLKREINERTSPPRFCHRHAPQALPLNLSSAELRLVEAFAAFRTAIHKTIASSATGRRRAGSFAVEILGKRLLSCPTAFAESWKRCKVGLGETDSLADGEVIAAQRQLARETADDREAQAREATAAGVVGAWLRGMAGSLTNEIKAIDDAVAGLGFTDRTEAISIDPRHDARFDTLVSLIEGLLREGGDWREDERLVVFTEYKTTLDYLSRRLAERYESERIRLLFGGLDDAERSEVKDAFNDPAAPVRILLATDAAAEGLNLQRTARYLLHFDCPWNPSRLEQRNGRLDRHGQARDVTVHYFVSDQDQDLRFLAHVISKADEIREDLGSANELFDKAAHRKLVAGESLSSVSSELDRNLLLARGRAAMQADTTFGAGEEGLAAASELKALAREIDLTPGSMRDTLETAMALRAGRPQLSCSAPPSTCKIINPSLEGWVEVIDESLRRSIRRNERGPVSRLAFDPAPLMETVGARQVFSPRPDVSLVHLSHPVMQRALSALTRKRFPGTGEEVSRWTVRTGAVPEGADALVLLSLEELAVNNLRETFHHWVRTLAFPVAAGSLGAEAAVDLEAALRDADIATTGDRIALARTHLDDVMPALKQWLAQHATELTAQLRTELQAAGAAALRDEDVRYRSRAGEVSALIAENTLAKLTREIEQLRRDKDQGMLFDAEARLNEIDQSINEKEAEILRRTHHYEEVRRQLESERERIIKHLLPLRHAMTAVAQVFPVTIEVILPRVVA